MVAAIGLVASVRPIAHRAVFPGDATPLDERRIALHVAGGRLLRFDGSGGAPLQAASLPGRGAAASRTTVVYFHATNQSAADALLFGADLARGGVQVLLPEHRGYGGLPGRPNMAALFDDAAAALDAAGLVPEGTVLVGRSLGAAVATEMARRGRGRALVLLSPFTSMDEMAGPARWALPAADRASVRAMLADVQVPVAILHGTRDGLVPFRMGEALATSHPAARFRALEGAGHNDLFLEPHRALLLEEILRAAGHAKMATR